MKMLAFLYSLFNLLTDIIDIIKKKKWMEEGYRKAALEAERKAHERALHAKKIDEDFEHIDPNDVDTVYRNDGYREY